MIKKILLSIILLGIVHLSYSGVITSCNESATKNIQTANSLLNFLLKYRNSNNTLSLDPLNQYFNINASLTREGALEAKNLKEIKSYISALNKDMHFSSYKAIDTIAAKNWVFIYFSSRTQYGIITQNLVFTELFQFKNGKIQKWNNTFSVVTPTLL